MEKLKIYTQEMATTHLSGERAISSIVLTISTGHEAFAGTDARVFLDCGDLGTFFLKTTGEDDFEIGDTRTYAFETNFTLEELRRTKLELGHDNSGVSPGWCVSHVLLHVTFQGSNLIFLYKHWEEIGWLAKNEALYVRTIAELQEVS